jgi:hypothetical protein
MDPQGICNAARDGAGRLPKAVIRSAWVFQPDHLIQTEVQSNRCLMMDETLDFSVDWEVEEEPEPSDDTLYTVDDYRADKAVCSDSYDSEPPSTDTVMTQERQIELAQSRNLAKLEPERRVVDTDAHIQSQQAYDPHWTGPSEKTQAELDARVARLRLVSGAPPPGFAPHNPRRCDDPVHPIDADGYLFPHDTNPRRGEGD